MLDFIWSILTTIKDAIIYIVDFIKNLIGFIPNFLNFLPNEIKIVFIPVISIIVIIAIWKLLK